MAQRTPHLHGAKVRTTRLERGLSKLQLGDGAEASYSHIDNIEYSRRPCSVELQYRIARELAVPLVELLCDDETCMDLRTHRDRYAPALVRRSA